MLASHCTSDCNGKATLDIDSDVLDGQLTHFSTMIVVGDLDRSERFYSRHFGFSKAQHLPHLRLLSRDGVSLYLVTESPPTGDKPGVTLAPPADARRPSVNLIFHVKDVRTTCRALMAGGLEFLEPPHQPTWGGWRVFAQDPDGYLIEIEKAE